MEIKYLTYLRDNPINNGSTYEWSIKPISLEEIAHLEQLYNNGKPFPKALKELLYLAGNYCYVFDKGGHETQQKLQDYVRKVISSIGATINRPFYALDIYGGDQVDFIYLDEGDNPPVYEAVYDAFEDDPQNWIHELGVNSLSELIDHGIDRVKEGRNPF